MKIDHDTGIVFQYQYRTKVRIERAKIKHHANKKFTCLRSQSLQKHQVLYFLYTQICVATSHIRDDTLKCEKAETFVSD